MKIEEKRIPDGQEDEVLIRVRAAGINRPDILQREGKYPAPLGASPILGLEVAGEIVKCGSKVDSWQEGDTVCALVNGGGYSEYCWAKAPLCLPIPNGLSLIEAASLPETFFTVWHNVFERAKLQKGETFLVHGGSSGIGVAAIQMAKAWGAHVIATVGSPEKCKACLELGADQAINYKSEDFVSLVKADVILDMVGGNYIAKNIKCLKPDGRLVSIAFLEGSKAEIDFMPIMLKRLTLTGSTLRPQSLAEKTRMSQAIKEHFWPLLENKNIRPVIFKVFPLDKVQEAHILMQTNQHIGKIILEI